MADTHHLSAERAALTRLTRDPRFVALDVCAPLSLFDVLRHTRDEVAHSRLIAALFSPRRHQQAEVALRAFITDTCAALARRPDNESAATLQKLSAILSAPWRKVSTLREYGYIDVLIEVQTAIGHAVIGVENKIDAGEQPDQLRRYQDTLSRAYPQHVALMVFLTPNERAATTSADVHIVPCVPLGYSALLRATHAALASAPADSHNHHTLHHIARHIHEEIMAENPIRQQVQALWREHPDALRLLVAHRPKLEDVEVDYISRLRVSFGDDAEFTSYPKRGEMSEIKMRLRSWAEKGFGFTWMLVSGSEGISARLLLDSDTYDASAQHLGAWAARVNADAIAGDLFLDASFRKIAGWTYWRRVFWEEDHPADTALDAQGCDAGTIDEAEERMLRLYKTLKPYVEPLLGA